MQDEQLDGYLEDTCDNCGVVKVLQVVTPLDVIKHPHLEDLVGKLICKSCTVEREENASTR